MGAPKGNKYAAGNPGGGRPTAYKPEYVKQVAKLCEMGATVNEIADFYGVHETTVLAWSHKHKEFSHALKVGRDPADDRVEMSLYRRATGFEKVIEKEIIDKNGETKTIKEKVFVPPETTAAIFWLKNRRRHEWRERQEHEIGRVGEFEKLSDNELEAFIEGTFTEISPGYSRAKVPRIEESSGKRSSRVRSSGVEDD